MNFFFPVFHPILTCFPFCSPYNYEQILTFEEIVITSRYLNNEQIISSLFMFAFQHLGILTWFGRLGRTGIHGAVFGPLSWSKTKVFCVSSSSPEGKGLQNISEHLK